MLVLAAVWSVGVEAYLGGDQGGEGAALDEAHLDGWGSISINCTASAGGLDVGRALGQARRWGSCGWRSTVMVVVMAAASFCERDLPLGAVSTTERHHHRQLRRQPQPPPCLLSTGQLARACSHPPCAPRPHALSPPHTAHTPPTRTFPTSTRRPLKMRPPSP